MRLIFQRNRLEVNDGVGGDFAAMNTSRCSPAFRPDRAMVWVDASRTAWKSDRDCPEPSETDSDGRGSLIGRFYENHEVAG